MEPKGLGFHSSLCLQLPTGNVDKWLTLCPHFYSLTWTYWPLPPSSLQWPMHCFKEIPSTWKWYKKKKKTSTAWKIIIGNHVTIPVRSTGTEWTVCAAETQSHQVEHFTLRDILGCLENTSPGNCNSALSGFPTPTSVLLFQMHFKCGQMECIDVDLGAKYGKVSKRAEIIVFKKL